MSDNATVQWGFSGPRQIFDCEEGTLCEMLFFLLSFFRNYGSSIYAQYEAVDFGCQQVLWLYGDDHQITEVGTMNLFLYWINEKGGDDCLQTD